MEYLAGGERHRLGESWGVVMRPIVTHVLLLFFALSLAGLASASACGTGKLLFEDKFATLNPIWGFGPTDPARSNGPGGLVYKIKPGASDTLLDQASFYDDYEVCIDFTIQAPANSNAYVGALFWGNDSENHYDALVFPALGSWAIYRFQQNKLLQPYPMQNAAAINKGLDTTNEISVTAVGSTATIRINGKTMTDFPGLPPQGGSLVGIQLGTFDSDTGPSTITVTDVQIRAPSGQTAITPAASAQTPAATTTTNAAPPSAPATPAVTTDTTTPTAPATATTTTNATAPAAPASPAAPGAAATTNATGTTPVICNSPNPPAFAKSYCRVWDQMHGLKR
jgi:hypothetical protein